MTTNKKDQVCNKDPDCPYWSVDTGCTASITEIERGCEKKAQCVKVEVEIWIQEILLSRFQTQFAALNNVVFDGSDIVKHQGSDIRIALFYRNFGGELEYPPSDYYQLNATYIGEMM